MVSSVSLQHNNFSIASLHTDVLKLVFDNLSGVEAAQASRVCKLWNRLLQDKPFWDRILEREFLYFPKNKNEDPKQVYSKQYIAKMNLDRGIYSTRTIRVGYDVCTSILTPDEKQIVSGCWDPKIQVWDLDTGKWVKSLRGHTDPVTALIFSHVGQLISGSRDQMIKVWDLKTGHCVKTLSGHTEGICAFSITKEGQFISGSFDTTIKVWDLEKQLCINTLLGHTAPVGKLIAIEYEVSFSESGERTEIEKKQLVSASVDKVVKIWDLETGKCRDGLTGDEKITSLHQNHRYIYAATCHKTTHVWDRSSDDNRADIGFPVGIDHYIVTNYGQRVVVIDPTKVSIIGIGAPRKDLAAHGGLITSLAVTQNGQLVTSSMDKTIRIWDFSKPKSRAQPTGVFGTLKKQLIDKLTLSSPEHHS